LRGRPPKPTATKILTGTFRKDRAPKREYQPRKTKKLPSPPSFLGKVAREEWRRVIPDLHAKGLLTVVDRGAITMYCQDWARWVQYEKFIDEMGATYVTENGYPVQRPEVALAQKYQAAAAARANSFGFNPAARTRIEVPEPKTEDPDDAFIFGDRGTRAG
jgi:P27 family predicted phage terminase small subunit